MRSYRSADGAGPAQSSQSRGPAPGKVTRVQKLAQQTAGRGQPLPKPLSQTYSSMGAQVDNVRVHAGAESAQAAESIGAKAFTVGNDIHFADGAYDPHTAMGRAILAHEVGHTQQSHGPVRCKTTSGEVHAGTEGAEREADQFAEAAAAADAKIVTPEEREKLEKELTQEARRFQKMAQKAVDDWAWLTSSQTSHIKARLKFWREKDMLSRFIAELRSLNVTHKLPTLAGGLGTKSCWRYLVSFMKESDQNDVWEILAKGNISAKNWGRLTDDLLAFWDERMAADVEAVETAWYRAQKGDDDEQEQLSSIVTIIEKYVGLDKRFGMDGTLLSRFLNRMNINTVKKRVIRPDEASILLNDLKEELTGEDSARLMNALNQSHLEMAKQPLPPDDGIGKWIADKLEGFADKADRLLGILANAPKNFRTKVWDYLCNFDQDLIVDFLIASGETFASLARTAVMVLSPANVLKFISGIDYKRLAKFMGAWLALGYVTIMAPIYLPVFLLLPEKRQQQVLALIDKATFKILLAEVRELAVRMLLPLIKKNWPVNVGIYLDRGVGVAPGAAFAEGEKYFHLIRSSETTMKYRERLRLQGGVGRSAGIAQNQSGNKGTNTKKKEAAANAKTQGADPKAAADAVKDEEAGTGTLAEAAGQAQAGAELIKVQVSEFPFTEDDAFMSLLLTILELDELTSAGAKISDSLAEVDPLAYVKEFKLELAAFGEAAAVGAVGVVQNGKDADTDKVHKWDGKDGRPDVGDPTTLQRYFGRMSGAAEAFLSIGGGVEIKESGNAKKKDAGVFDVMLSARASAVIAANINVPMLGNLARMIPRMDNEGGVRIVFEMSGIRTGEPKWNGEAPRMTLYSDRGDLDIHQSTGAEMDLDLDNANADTFESLESFRDAIDQFSIKKRFAIQIPVGSSWDRHIKKQRVAAALTHEDAQKYGAKLNAFLDLEIVLQEAEAKEAFDLIVESGKKLANKGLVKQLWADLQALLRDGKVPAYLQNLERIVTLLKNNVTKALLHISGGLEVAGRKSEFEYKGGLGVIYEKDISDALVPKIQALPDPELMEMIGDAHKAINEQLDALVASIRPT